MERVAETVEDSERKLQQAQDAIADVSYSRIADTYFCIELNWNYLKFQHYLPDYTSTYSDLILQTVDCDSLIQSLSG